jgi:hypothetical protein
MAVLASGQLTLLDHAKRLDPDGRIHKVAELLSTTNEVLEDAVWVEGNLPTGHQYGVRTGLPEVYWRLLNQGIPSSKSTTAQVTEACAMLEARSHIDVKVAALNGNTAEFRMSEDRPFIEAMNQRMATTLFYGNQSTDAKTFTGLAPRYSSLSAGNAQNILDAGGTSTDNTSIWLVTWGEETVFGTYPKGSQAGISHRDLGEDDVTDATGTYRALKTLYGWDCGMAVKDWRYAVRICNIDVSDIRGLTGTQAVTAATSILRQMAFAQDRLPSSGMGRSVFYMNRTVHSLLRIAAMEKASNVLSIVQGMNQFGNSQSWTEFDGMALRKADALLNTEARVT